MHITYKVVLFTILVSTAAYSQSQNADDDGYKGPMYLKRKPEEKYVRRPTMAEREAELSVNRRRFPGLDPNGIRFGELTIYPSVQTFFEYSDNVYSSENFKVSDMLYGFRPEVTVKSDLPVHEFSAALFAEDGNYFDIKDEDYFDYGAEFGARYDTPLSGLAFPVRLSWSKTHSRQDSPEDRNTLEPTVFTRGAATLGARYTGNLVEITANTTFTDIQYEDTKGFNGRTINNEDRDRYEIGHYFSYGLAPFSRIAPFTYLRQKSVTYTGDRDDFNLNRDSSEWEGGIGTNIALTSMTNSFMKLGYVAREFDDETLDDIASPTFEASLTWEPSTLAALTLTGQRFIRETSLDTSASVDSRVGLKAKYEVATNLLLEPGIEFLYRDYPEEEDQHSKQLTSGLDLTYKLNSNVWTTLEYTNVTSDEQATTFVPEDYDANIIRLSLKFQL